MRTIPVRTYYLEMRRCPEDVSRGESVESGISIERLPAPAVEFYRELYTSVGKTWGWVDRILMPAAQLQAILNHPRVEVYLLKKDGVVAGYGELDGRVTGEIELSYLGIKPEHLGRGFGMHLLRHLIRQAWSREPDRLWVHTCELDHPGALPVYLKAGFALYDERIIDQPMPE